MQEVIKVIDDATATTTSAAIPISGAQKVTFVFKRSGHSSGKTVFSVTVSADDSNYITYNKLIDNVANTNVQDLTRVASYDTGAANATKFYTLSPEDTFTHCKVTATETTDGTHDVWVIIERGER